MKISVVIPVVNERESLPATLQALSCSGEVHEVIAVDGGSTDGTFEWLRLQPGIRTLSSARGRGTQMNIGSLAATGDVLLFLHADAQLSPGAINKVRDLLKNEAAVGGCFCVRFYDAGRSSTSLAVIASGINLRSRLTRTATGDQAIFIRRSVFETIGGFREWPLFEDVDLVTRMKHRGIFRVIKAQVAVSARRYVWFGPWRTTFLIYLLRIGYWIGVSPFKLKEWFEDIRPHLRSPREMKPLSADSPPHW